MNTNFASTSPRDAVISQLRLEDTTEVSYHIWQTMDFGDSGDRHGVLSMSGTYDTLDAAKAAREMLEDEFGDRGATWHIVVRTRTSQVAEGLITD